MSTRWGQRLGRVVSLVFLAVLGTVVLMYCSPGYFSDGREMDAAHASAARTGLQDLRQRQGSLSSVLAEEIETWSHGGLGESRQYAVPVSSLLKERTARSGLILVTGVLSGWLAATTLAILLSLRTHPGIETLVAVGTALLLSLPVGVLAAVCVVANVAGPVFVLAVVVATRDFKVLHRLLQVIWSAPYLFHARAQGLSRRQIIRIHIAPLLSRELVSVGLMSFTLALSVLVPIEVVFDIPGLGQLAWAAAMNRDLPVLVAVTGIMAACVGTASLFAQPARSTEAPQCV